MNAGDLEQAARWHSRLQDTPSGASSEATRAGFAAWHNARNVNRGAFAAVTEADDLICEVRADHTLQSLGDEALARAEARGARAPRWGLTGMVAALVIAPVAALTLNHILSPSTAPSTAASTTEVFETAVGQRRVVRLSNAARILLDTASRLTVEGSLLTVRGQAEVTVGRSPIELQMDDARVKIRAGSFNVRVEDGRAELLGQDADAVATFRPPASPHPIVLKHGTLLSLEDGAASVRMSPDPDAVTGWQTGWLSFNNTPLAKAVQEINRYRQQPIRLAGNTAPLRISGSFRTGQGDAFMEAVAATLPATIDRSTVPPKIIVRGPSK